MSSYNVISSRKHQPIDGKRCLADDGAASVELPAPGQRLPERRGVPARPGRRRRRRTAGRAAAAADGREASAAQVEQEDLRHVLVRPRRDRLHEARVVLASLKYLKFTGLGPQVW